MNIALVAFEKMKQTMKATRQDQIYLVINALIYSLAIFAYAAFDRVLVGFIFVLITMVIIDGFLLASWKKLRNIPFTFYCSVAYTVGFLASLLFRFR